MSEKAFTIRFFKATFSWTWLAFGRCVLIYHSIILPHVSLCTASVAGRQASISVCSRETCGLSDWELAFSDLTETQCGNEKIKT